MSRRDKGVIDKTIRKPEGVVGRTPDSFDTLLDGQMTHELTP